jgi:hypothetical protein
LPPLAAASDDSAVLTRQVTEVIRKQVETGIDCVGNGEFWNGRKMVVTGPIKGRAIDAVRREINVFKGALKSAAGAEEAFICVFATVWLDYCIFDEHYGNEEDFVFSSAKSPPTCLRSSARRRARAVSHGHVVRKDRLLQRRDIGLRDLSAYRERALFFAGPLPSPRGQRRTCCSVTKENECGTLARSVAGGSTSNR